MLHHIKSSSFLLQPISMIILAILFCFSPAVSQTNGSTIYGVWQYDIEGLEGLAIVTPNHFVWVQTAQDRGNFASQEPTIQEKARAFETFNGGYATFKVDEEIGKLSLTHKYAKNPNMEGLIHNYEFEVVKDTAYSRFINPNGDLGPIFKAKKLENLPSTDVTSNEFVGAWEYTYENNMKGVIIASENYWIAANINRDQKSNLGDLSLMEERAKAYDNMTSYAGTYQLTVGSKFSWEVLYSLNPQMVGSKSAADMEITKDTWQLWYLDEDGNRIESTIMMAKRIE